RSRRNEGRLSVLRRTRTARADSYRGDDRGRPPFSSPRPRVRPVLATRWTTGERPRFCVSSVCLLDNVLSRYDHDISRSSHCQLPARSVPGNSEAGTGKTSTALRWAGPRVAPPCSAWVSTTTETYALRLVRW